MKEITYDPKNTSARTQYNKISTEDMEWLKKEFMRYVALMGELRNHKEISYRVLATDFWSAKDETLPKGSNGTNTPESFTCGMLNNLMFGNQQDLSDVQMPAIEHVSNQMHVLYEAVRKLGLQSKSLSFEEIRFKRKLFTIG